jgi:hypothetical protein
VRAFINALRGQKQTPREEPTQAVQVVIVAKTHLHRHACVGALALEDSRPMRLMQADCRNQPGDTDFQVGQVWELDCRPRPDIKPPHVEDVLVLKKQLVGEQPKLRDFILERVQPWHGHPKNTFEGLARPTYEGSGYINDIMGVPSMSTGFWIPDKRLTFSHNPEGKPYFEYPFTPDRHDRHRREIHRLPYVGYAEPEEYLPSGTLVRVSLARWWRQEGSEIEPRCYLQLSGWYF